MATRLETLAPDAGLDALVAMFDAGHVAIVDRRATPSSDSITRVDLLNYLRRARRSDAR